jgi:hypothetical protein
MRENSRFVTMCVDFLGMLCILLVARAGPVLRERQAEQVLDARALEGGCFPP